MNPPIYIIRFRCSLRFCILIINIKYAYYYHVIDSYRCDKNIYLTTYIREKPYELIILTGYQRIRLREYYV